MTNLLAVTTKFVQSVVKTYLLTPDKSCILSIFLPFSTVSFIVASQSYQMGSSYTESWK